MLEDDRLFSQADIIIALPANPDNSDEDSGDEEHMNMNNLIRSQLEAEAEVTVVLDCIWQERIGGDDDADTQEEPLTTDWIQQQAYLLLAEMITV